MLARRQVCGHLAERIGGRPRGRSFHDAAILSETSSSIASGGGRCIVKVTGSHENCSIEKVTEMEDTTMKGVRTNNSMPCDGLAQEG